MLWWFVDASRRAARVFCTVRGHRWSRFGDEDEDGWFWDKGGGASCYTRSCVRCDYMQHRDPPMRGRFVRNP